MDKHSPTNREQDKHVRRQQEDGVRGLDPNAPPSVGSPAQEDLKRVSALLKRTERLAQTGSWEWCPANGELVWSDTLFRIYGYEPGEVTPTLDAVARLVHPDDRERVVESFNVLPRTGELAPLPFRIVRSDGSVRHLLSIVATETDGDLPAIYFGTIQDRTDWIEAERDAALRSKLLDTVNTAIIVTDLKGMVTHWNPASEAMFGWNESEAIGRWFMDLTVGPRDVEKAEAIVSSSVRDGAWQGEFELQHKDGSRFPAVVQNARITDVTGQPIGVLGIIVDLSDRVEAERRLHSAYGHLEAITDAITDGVVTVDSTGRLDYMNPAALQLLGWSRDELEGKVMHDVVHYRRPDGSSFPIEECPLRYPRQGGETIHVDDDIFVKRDGSNLRVEYTSAPFETADGTVGSVVIFRDIADRKAHEEVLEQRIESLSWIGRIRDALLKERFVVHAQPIFDLRTDEVAFRELLIRMQDDDGSIVPPGQFLPIAEEFSIIADIDCWMISQAAQFAASGLAVTVNLSAQTVASREIGSVFKEAIDNSGADPRLIIVELTETALITNEHDAARSIHMLEDLGCRLALDDFGSGYGGFTYLKRFHFDYLKIDAEFVRDLPTNSASEHVVKAVVNLAEGFNQQVVAEGVEDETTLEALRDLGVDCAQGFHLARPGPLDAAAAPAFR